MKTNSKNTTQMSVILSDYFVLLEVPTFDLFILTARKQIRVPVAHDEASHCVYMASQSNLKLPIDKIPKLDSPII